MGWLIASEFPADVRKNAQHIPIQSYHNSMRTVISNLIPIWCATAFTVSANESELFYSAWHLLTFSKL